MSLLSELDLPGYRFTGKIGEGGMALVYKGEQLSLQRPVAIKVLDPKMIKHSVVLSAFERESVIIARLNHPNIIHVIDRGLSQGEIPFFIMEFVDGVDLSSLIGSAKLGHARKYSIAIQICKALAYAHRNGVIHRDIKPANVLLDREGHVKVLDFGISQFYGDTVAGEVQSKSDCGEVMGTWRYMAPELRRGEDATQQSDLYSLGLLLFELFSGHLPPTNVNDDHFDPAMPQGLVRIIQSCLSLNAKTRPANVDKVRAVLLQITKGSHLAKDAQERATKTINERQRKSFELLDVLRETTYSSVYLFQEKQSKQQVVVKKLTGTERGFDVNKLLAKKKLAHVAKIHGVSRNERLFIVVSEYLGGGSLQERLARPIQVETFWLIAEQMAKGLVELHSNSVIHGNLRPSNVLFGEWGEIKLVDCGLLEHYGEQQQGKELENWYCLAGEKMGVRSDLFALGVMYYQMLLGEPPKWKRDVLHKPRGFNALALDLQILLVELLEINPERRPRSAKDVVLNLSAMHSNIPTVVSVIKKVARKGLDKTLLLKRKRSRLFLWLVLLSLSLFNALTWFLLLQ